MCQALSRGAIHKGYMTKLVMDHNNIFVAEPIPSNIYYLNVISRKVCLLRS